MSPGDTIPAPSEDVVIAAGQARAACVVVLADLARAIGRTEQIMQAMARALDEGAAEGAK